MFLLFVFAICFSADLAHLSKEHLLAMIAARREMAEKPDYVRALEQVRPIYERMQKAHDNKFVEALKEVADAYEHTARRVIELSLDLNKSDEVSGYIKSIGGGLQLVGTAACFLGKSGGSIAKCGKAAVVGGRAMTVVSTLQDLTNLIIRDTEVKKRYKKLEEVISKHKDVKKTYPDLHKDFERVKWLVDILEEDPQLNELGLSEHLNDDSIQSFTLRYGTNVAYLAYEARELHKAVKSFRAFSNQMDCQFGLQTRSNWAHAADAFFAALDMVSGITAILNAHKQEGSLRDKLQKAEEQKKYLHDQADNINVAITKMLSEMRTVDLDRIAKQYGIGEFDAETTEKFKRKIEEFQNRNA